MPSGVVDARRLTNHADPEPGRRPPPSTTPSGRPGVHPGTRSLPFERAPAMRSSRPTPSTSASGRPALQVSPARERSSVASRGAMGYGLTRRIAAALVHRDGRVAVAGDGGSRDDAEWKRRREKAASSRVSTTSATADGAPGAPIWSRHSTSSAGLLLSRRSTAADRRRESIRTPPSSRPPPCARDRPPTLSPALDALGLAGPPRDVSVSPSETSYRGALAVRGCRGSSLDDHARIAIDGPLLRSPFTSRRYARRLLTGI